MTSFPSGSFRFAGTRRVALEWRVTLAVGILVAQHRKTFGCCRILEDYMACSDLPSSTACSVTEFVDAARVVPGKAPFGVPP